MKGMLMLLYTVLDKNNKLNLWEHDIGGPGVERSWKIN